MPVWSPYTFTMSGQKRKAETQDVDGAATAKKAGGGGGAAGGGDDTAALTPMVPRHVGLWSHKIELCCNTWEEIGNNLKYLPLCMSPRRFMLANRGQNATLIAQWRTMSTGFSICHASANVTNIRFLQDALTGGGTTPETTTAPTQAAYLVVFQPPPTSGNSILLGSGPAGAFAPIALDKNLAIGGTTATEYGTDQLMDLTSDTTDLETLRWVEFNLNLAGNSMTQVGPDSILYQVQKNSSQLTTTSGPTPTPTNMAYGASVDQIITAEEVFEQPTSQVLQRSNMRFVKLGESFSIPVTTNCNKAIFKSYGSNSVALVNTVTNTAAPTLAVFNNMETLIVGSGTPIGSLNAFFGWPCKVNPFWSRSNNWWYGGLVDALNSMAPLQHTFMCIAPMKDAEGALMKQRASCCLEQKMVVEYFFRDDLSNASNQAGQLMNLYDNQADLPTNNSNGFINNWVKAEVMQRPWVVNSTSTTMSTFFL